MSPFLFLDKYLVSLKEKIVKSWHIVHSFLKYNANDQEIIFCKRNNIKSYNNIIYIPSISSSTPSLLPWWLLAAGELLLGSSACSCAAVRTTWFFSCGWCCCAWLTASAESCEDATLSEDSLLSGLFLSGGDDDHHFVVCHEVVSSLSFCFCGAAKYHNLSRE